MSDPKRLLHVMGAIRALKDGRYPVARELAGVGKLSIVKLDERPWKDLPEPGKLAMLKDRIDWSGVTNRDQAYILLQELNVNALTDEQRIQLIHQAEPNPPQLVTGRDVVKPKTRDIEPER